VAEKIGKSEEDIKKFLKGIDEEMDDFKKDNISKYWDDIPDFYSGKTHWGKYRPSHKVSPILNFLRQTVERKTAQMTDAKPFVDILPYNDRLQRVANALTEIIISKWSEQSLELVLTDVIFYAELFGACGTNTLYDPKLHFGKGDITFHCIDPRNLNFDPAVTAAQHLWQGEYVRVEDIIPTSQAKMIYDNQRIKPDAPYHYVRDKRAGTEQGRTIRKVVRSMVNKKQAIDRSLLKEYWLQDRTFEGKKPKYPGGRHIIIAGEQIVVDRPNPYYDDRFPIDLLDWHRNPDSAWGTGEIDDLKELQRLVNKLVALVVENGILMTNAIWIGDKNALEPDQWDDLDNKPGLKVKIKPGTNLRREPGQPLDPTLFSAIQYVENAIYKIGGDAEVTKGGVPGEVKSGIAIEALQQAAMATIRLKSRGVEQLLERIGQKMIARIFQFEKEDRLMWRLKSDQDYEMYKFFKSMLRDKELFPNGPKDAWKDFLFKIRPGSSLAMNQWQKAMVAMQMYQAQPKPLIDRLGVLETMDWPGRTEIIERLEQQEQAEMEAQMQMMQQQQQMASGAGGSLHIPSHASKGGSAPRTTDIRGQGAAQGAREAINKTQGVGQ
jgi:hypothetical protein